MNLRFQPGSAPMWRGDAESARDYGALTLDTGAVTTPQMGI
jgi:hypothetical protein